MKTKNGKVMLEKGEVRTGNYFIKEESEHVKIADLNSVFTFRIKKEIPIGQFVLQGVAASKEDESSGRGLENWMAVLSSVLCTVPDLQFLEELFAAAESCIKRHPDAYGYPPEEEALDEAAQREAEEEARELMEFEKDLKNLPE